MQFLREINIKHSLYRFSSAKLSKYRGPSIRFFAVGCKMNVFLDQKQAQSIDDELMSTLAFSIDQLMELAGLSCAQSVEQKYNKSKYERVLVICGPGAFRSIS